MVGGDVVRQHRQRAQSAQGALAGQRAFPVRRAADVGGLRAPVVQRVDAVIADHAQLEHRPIDLAEVHRFDALGDNRVNLGIGRPNVFERHRLAVLVGAEYVFFNIKAHRARNRVGHHQRRRGQKGLLGIRVDAPVKVAVARQHGGGVQIALNDFLLYGRVECAAHAVAGGAGKADDAKAQLLQFFQQIGVLQVQLDRFGAGRQRGLDPRLAREATRVGVARQQRSGNHVARVAGVGAAGNRRNDDGSVGHVPRRFLPRAGNAARRQVRCRQALVRIGRPGHVAHHAGQIKAQHALVFGARQRIRPQAGVLGVGFNQCHLRGFAPGQLQIINGLLVDIKQRRRRAKLGCHVGDGGAVAQRQGGCTFAVELQIRADDFLLAQVFGQRQHHVGGSDAGLGLAGQLDADDVGQAHPRGTPQHHALGFQPADADGNHAQRINVRRVAVGADQRVGEGHAAL